MRRILASCFWKFAKTFEARLNYRAVGSFEMVFPLPVFQWKEDIEELYNNCLEQGENTRILNACTNLYVD